MKRITYYYHDRSEWQRPDYAEGEPDKVQWKDEATGLPCLIVRNYAGAWCGYVGVSKGHKYYAINYSDVDYNEVDVHGGLTFSDSCSHNEHGRGICHKVEHGEDDEVWWLGFDCNHLGDVAPAREGYFEIGSYYKNQAYVTREVTNLAKQLAAL